MTSHPKTNISLFSLALGGLAIGSTEFAIMGLLPQVANGLHISIPEAGHLISSYALGVVIGAPLFAVLTARWNRKTTLIMLMILFTLGNSLSAFAPGYHTMLVARFLSGLPHGAYFGIAAVAGSILAGKDRRGHAVSMVMMGLTVANLLSVPLLTLLGQNIGWRWAFGVIGVMGFITVCVIALVVPPIVADRNASMLKELSAMKRPQVLLTLLTGMIGFGGFFSVYSYIAPMMTDVTGFKPQTITLILSLYGLGMTIGNFVGGRVADWNVDKGIYIFGLAMTLSLLVFTVAIHNKISALPLVFLMGFSVSAYTTPLQSRLMDVAHGAENLASSLSHSALNIANAIGAWLGGLVIAAGYGFVAPVWVGVALSIAGLACAYVTITLNRKNKLHDGQKTA